MKPIFGLLLMILLAACCKDKEMEACPCFSEDQYPTYRGCEPVLDSKEARDCALKEMLKLVYSTIKYPEQARMDSIEGKVLIMFVIYTDGSIGEFEIVEDPSDGTLGEAALEGILKLNEQGFCPRLVDCIPEEFDYYFPVSFKL